MDKSHHTTHNSTQPRVSLRHPLNKITSLLFMAGLISGPKVFECPIYSDCPLVGIDGSCTCYGYDLRRLNNHYLKRCPQYMRDKGNFNDFVNGKERWDNLLAGVQYNE